MNYKLKILTYPKKLLESFLIRYYKKRHKYKNLIDILYQRKFKKKIDWEKPGDLNQWISWLIINTDISKWSLLADKYRVREYIKEKGYEDILIPILAKWDSPENLNFTNLPDSFILKINNGSGDVVIIKDKNKVDINEIKQYFKSLFNRDYGQMGEIHYSKIKPVIIAEELLDPTKQSITTTSLIDYKVWSFNGKVESIWTCYDRCKESVKVMSYDTDWIAHPEWHGNSSHYLPADIILPKPKNLKRMIEIASNLSKGFPQMRIDFYEVGGRIYFGEITMSSNGMQMEFYNEKYLKYLGNKCKKETLNLKSID